MMNKNYIMMHYVIVSQSICKPFMVHSFIVIVIVEDVDKYIKINKVFA